MTEPHVEHVIEGSETATEHVHESASEIAQVVGDAVSQAHSEALDTMRATINALNDRIVSLEYKLQDSHEREHATVLEHANQATELAEAVVVAHAIEAVHETEEKANELVVEPAEEGVTEVEDTIPEHHDEESKPKPRRHRLYGKRG